MPRACALWRSLSFLALAFHPSVYLSKASRASELFSRFLCGGDVHTLYIYTHVYVCEMRLPPSYRRDFIVRRRSCVKERRREGDRALWAVKAPPGSKGSMWVYGRVGSLYCSGIKARRMIGQIEWAALLGGGGGSAPVDVWASPRWKVDYVCLWFCKRFDHRYDILDVA